MNGQNLWDKKAKQYYEAQLSDQSDIVSQVIDQLRNHGVLENAHDLLDVGGGTGRYGIPFSKNVQKVIISDYSKEMLFYANEYAKLHHRNNIEFIQNDWLHLEVEKIQWDKKFDIVFSSMSPATRNIEGLLKMEEASKKWCVLNQFTRMHDSMISMFKKSLGTENQSDPHEDYEYVTTVMKELFQRSRLPIIFHSRYRHNEIMSKDQIIKRYGGRFESSFNEKGINFNDYIDSIIVEGLNRIEKDTVMTTIIWNIKNI